MVNASTLQEDQFRVLSAGRMMILSSGMASHTDEMHCYLRAVPGPEYIYTSGGLQVWAGPVATSRVTQLLSQLRRMARYIQNVWGFFSGAMHAKSIPPILVKCVNTACEWIVNLDCRTIVQTYGWPKQSYYQCCNAEVHQSLLIESNYIINNPGRI